MSRSTRASCSHRLPSPPPYAQVKVPGSSEFEKSTLLTRSTYSLDQVSSGCAFNERQLASQLACLPTTAHGCRQGSRSTPASDSLPALSCLHWQMSGSVTVKGDGTVALKETDGIDFSPVTVKASWEMYPSEVGMRVHRAVCLSRPAGCVCALHPIPDRPAAPTRLPTCPADCSSAVLHPACRTYLRLGPESSSLHPACQAAAHHPPYLTPFRPANPFMLRRSGVARWCPSCSP